MMDLLNHCLEVGENYIPYIFDMLAKFRWNAVALTADIEKAFLMVGIKQEDRGVDVSCGTMARLLLNQMGHPMVSIGLFSV